MKKTIILLLLLLAKVVYAQVFIVNSIQYEVTSTTLAEAKTIQYLGGGYDVNIPPTVTNPNTNITYTVTEIDYFTFFDYSLNSVTLPNTIVHIGEAAFEENNLTKIVIPESVTSIGFSPFFNNPLSSVTSLSNDPAVIDATTFSSNSGTLSLTIPYGTTAAYAAKGWTTAIFNGGITEAPSVTSVTVPNNANYTTGQHLDFTVNFNENITVNTIGSTPQLSLTIGTTTRQATYQNGSGTSALTFRYTVQAGDKDTDGIAVGTLSANGSTLQNTAGNNALLTLNNVGSTTGILVTPTHTFTNGGGNLSFEDASNWDTNQVPADGDNIIVSQKEVRIHGNVTLNDVTIYRSIVTLSTSTPTSVSSLIVNGTITNTESRFDSYQLRDIKDDKWHLISAPFSGFIFIPEFLYSHPAFIDPILASNGTHIALGEYTNTPDSDGDWSYPYAIYDGNVYTFQTAKGYAIKYANSPFSSISEFTRFGTYPTLPVTTPLTIGQAGDATNENPWNLVGNPFPSRVDIAQFLTDNANVLKSTHQAVYVWNPNAGTDGEYQQLTTGSIEIGQGFFVSAKNATGDNISFTADSRTHTAGTFYRNSAPNIKLLANDAYTQINFSETATNGLDPRFDVGTFGGVASNFKLFTQLVANNEGVSFMQQTLPTSGLESAVIPVGVQTKKTKEVVFKIEANNLPAGTFVYLEDKQAGVLTNITTENYTATVTNNEATTGRFYLHTSAKALSNDAVAEELAGVSIYKSSAKTVSITGLQAENATIKMYSVLGKEVFAKAFSTNGNSTVSLPQLASGIYIVTVHSELGKVSKKIIME